MIETPPEEQIPPGSDAPPRNGDAGSAGRYSYLDTHELITLLEDVDDERSRARFRESIYLAIILWLILGLLYVFLPRWLPHPPTLVVAPQRNPREMTYLDVPPDLQKQFKNRPAPHLSERSTQAQTPKPTNEPRPPEPKAGSPRSQPAPQQQPGRTAPQQAAPQQSAPQQQAPQPQQPVKVAPAPHPSNSTPLVDSPAPSQQRQPNFGSGQSVGSAIADAARSARSGGASGESGDYGSVGRGNSGSGKAGVQILSDTQGVDFNRYLQHLLADVRRNWLPLIPEECNSPLFKQGITGVRFTIQPNGEISAMHLDYSTHDVAIDRAAWGSIKSLGQAAPLPKEFHGPNLELRIEFRVNKDRNVQ